jgi:nicotinamide mononucleotide adenylyltransferase
MRQAHIPAPRAEGTLLPAITVHGRFQPPVHVNHWRYIYEGFKRAERVDILITNPYIDEAFDAAASWRSDPMNNPFSFDERVFMFTSLLAAKGIDASRYTIRPFNIKDPASFQELDPSEPNLVNVYSEWSAKKVNLFTEHGLEVVRLDMPKTLPVSGTILRQMIFSHQGSDEELAGSLVTAGLIPEAVPGLLEVLHNRQG